MKPDSKAVTRRAFGMMVIGSAVAATTLRAQAGPGPTPAMTEGPFFPLELPTDSDADLTMLDGHNARALGDVIQVRGRVLDGHGNPLAGARLQLWQANAAGRYSHPGDAEGPPLDPNFQGYADLRADAHGEWRITTVKPGAYASPIGRRTPHIHGIISDGDRDLTTQMFFSDEGERNAEDSLFRDVGADRDRLLATLAGEGLYDWTVILDS